jgi:hypothetical protein
VAAGSFHDTDTANYSAEDFRFTTKGYRPIGVAWPARERVQAVVLLGNDTKLRLEQRLPLHLEHLHFHHVNLAFVGVHVGAQFDVMSHVIL